MTNGGRQRRYSVIVFAYLDCRGDWPGGPDCPVYIQLGGETLRLGGWGSVGPKGGSEIKYTVAVAGAVAIAGDYSAGVIQGASFTAMRSIHSYRKSSAMTKNIVN